MRSRLVWLLCVFSFACQPPRTLEVFAQPARIDNHGQVTRIRVSANEGEGVQTGAVKVSSTVGSLIEPESATLESGNAEVGFACDVALDPGCEGAVVVTATWKSVTAETTVQVGTGGTGGGSAQLSPGFIAACGASVDGTVPATIRIDADDYYALYVNGSQVVAMSDLWYTAKEYAVTLNMHPSKPNVIAVKAWNAFVGPDLDRALIVDAFWTVGSTTSHVVTGDPWRLSRTAQAGWETPGFNPSGWTAPVNVGENGVAPYGTVFGTSTAKWVWSYEATGPASGKMLDDEIYVRAKFTLTENGRPSFTMPSCP